MIDDVPYPDVLVARAVQAQGGLDAVLYPGASGGRHRLGLSGLDPGATYACEGTEERSLVASCHGSAVVTVALTDRTAIRVRPAA